MTDEHSGRVERNLQRDLARMAGSGPREESFRSRLRGDLAAETARKQVAASAVEPAAKSNRRGAGFAPPARRILVGLAAAVVVAATLVVGLGRIGGSSIGPAPAEAQAVLRSATALSLGPNQVAHYVYRVTISGIGVKDATTGTTSDNAVTGTTSVWFAEPGGKPVVSAQDITISKGGSVSQLLSRYVQVGDQLYGYDGAHDAILLPYQTVTESLVLPSAAFDTGSAAQSLQATVAKNGALARSVTQQTLDGRAVDAITVDGAFDKPAMRATFYFDTATHVLRGFDAGSVDPSYPTPSWKVRLASSQIVSAATVPASAFLLNAPASARVYPPTPDKQALLRLVPDLKTTMQPGVTLLAAVRAAHPGISEEAVIAALFGSTKAAVDTALAGGQITPAQAATVVPMERAQIETRIGAQSPAPKASGTVRPAG